MKILIVKRDKIGDLLLTTPFIAALAQALPGGSHRFEHKPDLKTVFGHPTRILAHQPPHRKILLGFEEVD